MENWFPWLHMSGGWTTEGTRDDGAPSSADRPKDSPDQLTQ